MRFEWDERKNAINRRKHGLDFSRAKEMFTGSPFIPRVDAREEYGEIRWFGLGLIGGIVAAIVFTYEYDIDTVRVISLRRAGKNEQNEFYKEAFRSE